MHITVETPILETPRVLQVRGMFDLPPEKTSRLDWDVELPLNKRPWQVGLVVGPSGCGKSTIARGLWPAHYVPFGHAFTWPRDQSVLDAFPEAMPAREVTGLLSAVGFSSPPAWLRPYHVLSTGQQFRVTLARLLAERTDLAVVDEFTSTVDRTAAQVGSHALARAVRARRQRFVAVTCHEDVEPWLDPDWVYRPDGNLFAWRFLRRRPGISLQVCRVHPSAWAVFRSHHYLNTSLNPSARCFVAFRDGRPVAFSAWIHALSKAPAKREHRTVTLPDYQGAGIGHALSSWIAALYKAMGYRATSTTSHPAFIAARSKDPNWRMTRPPSLAHGPSAPLPRLKHATTRLTAGFEYVGPPGCPTVARHLLGYF
jgi:energy-coupling factor transporter ATP-binding protein EcfA2